MGLFDMFTTAPQQTQAEPQPQQPTPPGNIPDSAAQGTQDGTVPNAPAAENKQDSNPLDEFKTLWEPVTTKEGDPKPNPDFVPLDPTKLQEVVSKASFTDTVTPEVMEAINQGGEGAAAAFSTAMNAVAQKVMMQATLASNKMTEQAVKRALETQAAKFPELLKKQTTLDSNPLFSNPAVKPVIEAVQSQLAIKNPNASAAELASMAESFITVMGEQFAPKAVNTDSNPQEEDWGKFFS